MTPPRSPRLPSEVLLLRHNLMLAPSIPDDAPDAVREGMVRRRLALLNGACPCGARVERPNRAARRAAKADEIVLPCHHDDDCPASDDNLRVALAQWRAS